jgi:hypothetical protein
MVTDAIPPPRSGRVSPSHPTVESPPKAHAGVAVPTALPVGSASPVGELPTAVPPKTVTKPQQHAAPFVPPVAPASVAAAGVPAAAAVPATGGPVDSLMPDASGPAAGHDESGGLGGDGSGAGGGNGAGVGNGAGGDRNGDSGSGSVDVAAAVPHNVPPPLTSPVPPPFPLPPDGRSVAVWSRVGGFCI